MMDDDSSRRVSPFLPLLLLTVALLVWAGSQTVQLTRERQDLQLARSNQETTVQLAAKLREQLDGLANDTAALAAKGNAGAATIVQELAKRGISIKLNAPPAAPPK